MKIALISHYSKRLLNLNVPENLLICECGKKKSFVEHDEIHCFIRFKCYPCAGGYGKEDYFTYNEIPLETDRLTVIDCQYRNNPNMHDVCEISFEAGEGSKTCPSCYKHLQAIATEKSNAKKRKSPFKKWHHSINKKAYINDQLKGRLIKVQQGS